MISGPGLASIVAVCEIRLQHLAFNLFVDGDSGRSLWSHPRRRILFGHHRLEKSKVTRLHWAVTHLDSLSWNTFFMKYMQAPYYPRNPPSGNGGGGGGGP